MLLELRFSPRRHAFVIYFRDYAVDAYFLRHAIDAIIYYIPYLFYYLPDDVADAATLMLATPDPLRHAYADAACRRYSLHAA